MPMICFIENNDNEGETWHWFVPVAEQAMPLVAEIQQALLFYTEDPDYPEYEIATWRDGDIRTYEEVEVQVLCDNARQGYMPSHQRTKPMDLDALLWGLKTARYVDDVMYKGKWVGVFGQDI